MLKAIFKGGDFQCSQGNGTIIFELADNSSKLIFGPDGSVASLISSDILENNYLNGGMDLGTFNFLKNSTIISNLKSIVNSSYYDINCLSNWIISLVNDSDINFTAIVSYLSDPKLVASVVGGLLFEAGMIALPTGLPGLALLGLGTVLTAYGSGMFDDLGTDHPGYAKPENQLNFGLSMTLNFLGLGGSEGFLRGVLYNEVQEKLVVGFVPSIKAYGKTIIKETFYDDNGVLAGVAKSYFDNILQNILFDTFLKWGVR
ncbi:hypothetical protein mru_2125 [Methanobrevibacter ruminantium M1]|uniref:Uncharacterized protein n=1 Tax=Methanobrevibacter ruminantium (strain ATCC 35063 / DSM 1093 / JCM 13430 / OCM 146 / M1) TaxID=634498 RepID=D3E101_METRM|nr:hypothetical protein [Methanobrevibacter ruminantium]ADC47975.1 hypothetical protein mru_2125 [Methanobrevibacter ruminantium M1]